MPLALKRPARIAGFVVAALLALLAAAEPALAQAISIDFGGQQDATLTARVFQGIFLITVLSLAPGILIMVTSFVRIVVVLSLLRSALGLQQAPPNIVLISLALFLTGFIMAPTLEAAWERGLRPMLNEDVTQEQGVARMVDPFKAFMLGQVRASELEFFDGLAARLGSYSEDVSPIDAPLLEDGEGPRFDPIALMETQAADGTQPPAGTDAVSLRVLVPAFMISELRRAFEIGFLIFMPFLIIDLVVAALLMSMGMMMLPPAIVALPFKVIFFVLINGWQLTAGSLVLSFAGGA